MGDVVRGVRRLGVGLAALVAFVAAPVVGGCEPDECRSGQSECAGGVARNCVFQWDNELTGHRLWQQEACGPRQCLIAAGRDPGRDRTWAVCALAPDPDPLCPAEPLSETVTRCDGNDGRVACMAGYRVGAPGCADSTTCIDVLDPDSGCTLGARCSLLDAADPRCGRTVYSTCDGTLRVECDCGIRTAVTGCPESCVATDTPVDGVPGVTFTTAACR